MKIIIKPFLTFRPLMGKTPSFEMETGKITIRELLDALSEKFGEKLSEQLFDPKTRDISPFLKVLYNGRHYTTLPDKLETALEDGDEISFFPPIAGG